MKNHNYAKRAYAWEGDFPYGASLDLRHDLLVFLERVSKDYGMKTPSWVQNRSGSASWAQVRPNRDKLRGGKAAGFGAFESRICLQNGLHRSERIVLHELAHIVVWLEHGHSCGHGGIWTAAYVELVARYISPRVAREMIAAAPAGKVKVEAGWRADGTHILYIGNDKNRRAKKFGKRRGSKR